MLSLYVARSNFFVCGQELVIVIFKKVKDRRVGKWVYFDKDSSNFIKMKQFT